MKSSSVDHGVLRSVDAFCPTCGEIRPHDIAVEDPGSCACRVCGHVELVFRPMAG